MITGRINQIVLCAERAQRRASRSPAALPAVVLDKWQRPSWCWTVAGGRRALARPYRNSEPFEARTPRQSAPETSSLRALRAAIRQCVHRECQVHALNPQRSRRRRRGSPISRRRLSVRPQRNHLNVERTPPRGDVPLHSAVVPEQRQRLSRTKLSSRGWRAAADSVGFSARRTRCYSDAARGQSQCSQGRIPAGVGWRRWRAVACHPVVHIRGDPPT